MMRCAVVTQCLLVVFTLYLQPAACFCSSAAATRTHVLSTQRSTSLQSGASRLLGSHRTLSVSAADAGSAACRRRCHMTSMAIPKVLGAKSAALGSSRRILATAVAGTAAVASIGGGVLSGGLHAVSGPDHLAALLPRIMGKPWPSAMRYVLISLCAMHVLL
jgi:hypothetical protein